MWQAEDLSWRPLVLGAEEGWPPRVWPPDTEPEQPQTPVEPAPPVDSGGLPEREPPRDADG
jgi:hypothetical protein